MALMREDESLYFDNIRGDENRCLQIIINFLSNSLKFSNRGSKIIVALKVFAKSEPTAA